MSTKHLVLEILLLRAMLADRYLHIRLQQGRSTRSTDRLETATLKPLEAESSNRLKEYNKKLMLKMSMKSILG